MNFGVCGVFYMGMCVCVRAYRRCVVRKCPQVSHIGVDKSASTLNLGADIMVRSMGNKYSHTETQTHIQDR